MSYPVSSSLAPQPHGAPAVAPAGTIDRPAVAANDLGSSWPATGVEAAIEWAAHRVLSRSPDNRVAVAAVEFLVFGLKQAWACLFGGMLVGLIIATALIYPRDFPIARYDFLFLAAVTIQSGMLAFRLETVDEAKVIFVYHVVGTAMEIFKTAAGSWVYPEEALFRVGGVPLFSGFMYAAIGSYIARCFRLFDFQFSNYPPRWAPAALAAAIYVNFFSHHFIVDVRMALLFAVVAIYGRTFVHYRVFRFRHQMPLAVGFLLVSLFIWIAENIGTLTHTWAYPNQQAGWQMVSLGKLGSWYLLMIVSFVLVTLVNRPQPHQPPPPRQ